MASALTFSERVVTSSQLADSSLGIAQVYLPGSGPMPDRTWELADGTGNQQGKYWYYAQRTCTASSSDNLDLSGSLTNPITGTITLTAVKRVLIRIVSPDGTKKLYVGPQAVSNAWATPWGGAGATVYTVVYEEYDIKNSWGGWAVTAGTGDILGISNPGGSDVTYAILIVGK